MCYQDLFSINDDSGRLSADPVPFDPLTADVHACPVDMTEAFAVAVAVTVPLLALADLVGILAGVAEDYPGRFQVELLGIGQETQLDHAPQAPPRPRPPQPESPVAR